MTDRPTAPVSIVLQLRTVRAALALPPGTTVLSTRQPPAVEDVPGLMAAGLASPLDGPPLADLARQALTRDPAAPAVVVVSDNTRPVPYKGEDGILWPIVETLLGAGYPPTSIRILVATGTHRKLSDLEMRLLLDERALAAGVGLVCHDSRDASSLVHVGASPRGTPVFVDREYVGAGLRILTGLVETHFMAGVSGGRKSICPGLLGVESVEEFHGPAMIDHPQTRDMSLAGNPCHEYAEHVALMVPPDFTVNVTIRQDGRTVGVFAGGMDTVLHAAFAQLESFALVPVAERFDVVVTHAGLVGVNHYQAAKAASAAARATVNGGFMVLIADATEPDPVGTGSYRRLLSLYKEIGADEFRRRIFAEGWGFVPDQWEVQMWARILDQVPEEHLFYLSPQTTENDYAILPCTPPPAASEPAALSTGPGEPGTWIARATTLTVAQACVEATRVFGRVPRVAYLADGPYGIPVVTSDPYASRRPVLRS